MVSRLARMICCSSGWGRALRRIYEMSGNECGQAQSSTSPRTCATFNRFTSRANGARCAK